MDPVGLTRFTTCKNSRLLLLLRKVMAVPLCPSRPALPICMGRDEGYDKVVYNEFPNLAIIDKIRHLLKDAKWDSITTTHY